MPAPNFAYYATTPDVLANWNIQSPDYKAFYASQNPSNPIVAYAEDYYNNIGKPKGDTATPGDAFSSLFSSAQSTFADMVGNFTGSSGSFLGATSSPGQSTMPAALPTPTTSSLSLGGNLLSPGTSLLNSAPTYNSPSSSSFTSTPSGSPSLTGLSGISGMTGGTSSDPLSALTGLITGAPASSGGGSGAGTVVYTTANTTTDARTYVTANENPSALLVPVMQQNSQFFTSLMGGFNNLVSKFTDALRTQPNNDANAVNATFAGQRTAGPMIDSLSTPRYSDATVATLTGSDASTPGTPSQTDTAVLNWTIIGVVVAVVGLVAFFVFRKK